MAIHVQHLRAWMIAAGLVFAVGNGKVAAQQSVMSTDPELAAIRHQMELQQQEMRALRARLAAVERANAEPLPPVGLGDTLSGSDGRGGEAQLTANDAHLDSLVSSQESSPEKAPEPYEVGSDLEMRASWHHGLEVSSKNKDFRLHVGGRTQVDTTWYSGDDSIETSLAEGGVGPLQDSWNFRRGRFGVDGTFYEVIDFACEYDFINEAAVDSPVSLLPPQGNPVAVPSPTDLWVQVTHLPVLGTVRVGNRKDPFGFEHLMSSRFLNFMERSFMQDAFAGPFNNGFIPGIQAFNTYGDERGTWAAGVFKNVNNAFANGVGDGEYETAGRITFLPWYEDEGRRLLHLGIAGAYKALDEDQTRFRSRGNLRSGAPGPHNPAFANTGNFIGDDQTQYGLELAGVSGPWSFQSEYMSASVHDSFALASPPGTAGLQAPPGTPLGTVTFDGFYFEVHYFLTGESRAYNRRTGVFDRVVPYGNFFVVRDQNGNVCSDWGAWQVLARYQYLDLRDPGIDGGHLDAITLGLNWFLNPNLKVQWNYDWTHRDFVNNLGASGNGDIHGFGTRVAFDF
jgi:phosphate-selective porin OprO/OprP